MTQMKSVIKGAAKSALVTFVLMTPMLAHASAEGGGRDLEDGVNSIRSLLTAIGLTGYTLSLVAAIVLFVIGGIIWALSGRNQGDNSKSKSVAAGFMIAAILLGSITGFMSMGSNTVTKQNSEIEAFLSEE
ncbi:MULTISPECIES: hypothetical protein [Vibrio]|uniref:hypothetical protein n=1 Tax=Vibrio TaxID=662 RepID=UPI0004DFC0FA|nr:hypothetical protein [Vibrio parahaemolyticus]EGQ9239467.1 hypothetical protein [Vibrio vulnificus]EHD1698109.1 hypothetical protein [Vibrio vulnificus]EKZ9225838.1 hypothetical protein [Vibrio vulnificus]ELC9582680.1 hypothetical protein [Vibrio vulnificus]MCU8149783.1 hypothetical protein [Vibrio vulnificus]